MAMPESLKITPLATANYPVQKFVPNRHERYGDFIFLTADSQIRMVRVRNVARTHTAKEHSTSTSLNRIAHSSISLRLLHSQSRCHQGIRHDSQL